MRTAPAPRGTTPSVVLAAVIWTVTVLSLTPLAITMLIVGLFALSDGEFPPLLLGAALVAVVAGGALTLLYYAPCMRRLSLPARLAVLGALAFPVSSGLSLWALSV
ncbi:hypothetical protein [Streptomyces sp. CB03238]|uniref:hypothetical protein n=1 Tax=Streptomyces sp. CB03238 TaxID=1907777 RepID=UPI000A0F7908|nr:hypothetical protein [Streptomyces sp. CB03238]ORT59782.1 hypothetical protein BKD26_12905 [Streptomyces sp. CB03238]